MEIYVNPKPKVPEGLLVEPGNGSRDQCRRPLFLIVLLVYRKNMSEVWKKSKRKIKILKTLQKTCNKISLKKSA